MKGERLKPVATNQRIKGMTGLWQVSGKNELAFEGRLRLEEYYVRNWSLWLDFKILIRTIPAILSRKGAW